jgi:glycosyltransferase involved in cell wall biosynthesis
MLPTFSDPDEFGDELRRLLADDSHRETIAAAARAAVASRTFTNNARELLRLLGS